MLLQSLAYSVEKLQKGEYIERNCIKLVKSRMQSKCLKCSGHYKGEYIELRKQGRLKQKKIDEKLDKQRRDDAIQYVAKFFYEIPFSITKFIAAGVGVPIPTEQLLRSLVLTLLVPLILGKVARELSKGLADFADGNRKLLAVISAVFLSFAPWIQVSRSRSLLLMVKPENFLVAVIMGVFLHVALLAFNALLIPSLSLISGGCNSPFAKKENISALLLVASQKTLPVMVAVVDQLGGALGESGLLVLPCVAAHLNQIIIDSFLVSLWKKNEGALESIKTA